MSAPTTTPRAARDELAWRDYQPHPLANIFPLLEGDEFKALVADIKANGLRHKIVLHEGMILDGRNRHRACIGAFVVPDFEDLQPHKDPLDYVLSANLHRRHLTTSQRALIAGRLVTTKLGDNQHKLGNITAEKAAKMLNVSEALVKIAKDVEEKGAEGIKFKVRKGELRLGTAKDIIEKPMDQQEAELVRIKQERKAQGKPARKGSKTNQAIIELDEFKKKWQGFGDMQRRAFVMSFKAQIAELLAGVQQQEAMLGG